jgi:hypothetical protein
MEAERDYWGTDRASFEDELEAWRERTACDMPPTLLPIRAAAESSSAEMPTLREAA